MRKQYPLSAVSPSPGKSAAVLAVTTKNSGVRSYGSYRRWLRVSHEGTDADDPRDHVNGRAHKGAAGRKQKATAEGWHSDNRAA